jgi:hypothetical protein
MAIAALGSLACAARQEKEKAQRNILWAFEILILDSET